MKLKPCFRLKKLSQYLFVTARKNAKLVDRFMSVDFTRIKDDWWKVRLKQIVVQID